MLWEAFPLGRSRAPLTPPVASGAVAPAIVVEPANGRSSWAAFVAGLLVAIAVAGALALLVLRGPARRWTSLTGRSLGGGAQGQSAYIMILPGRLGRPEQVFERAGRPPELGEVIYDASLGRESQGFVVEFVGASPFPGDSRPCAFLVPL